MGTRELWRRLALKRTGILNEELNLTCMRSNPNDHEYKTYIFLAMLASGSLVLFTLISQLENLPYDTGFGFQTTHRPHSLGFQKKKGGSEGKLQAA